MTDIESKLREFRPRRPAAIPDERLMVLRGPLWVAVAAGAAAVMFVTAHVQKPTPVPPTSPSARLGALTAVALGDPDQLDAVLTRLSGEVLPEVYDALQPAKELR